jgi:predicted nuclease of predicted toxin-antitoxin system
LRVFFDEDVPRKLARFLPRHEIQTVVAMEWGGIKNGALLKLIEREGFQVFLTGDKNIESQQRLEGLPFAVLVMSAINWPVVRPHIHKIAAAVEDAQPGTVKRIDCGVFVPRLKRASE